jgi:hypothetical protein
VYGIGEGEEEEVGGTTQCQESKCQHFCVRIRVLQYKFNRTVVDWINHLDLKEVRGLSVGVFESLRSWGNPLSSFLSFLRHRKREGVSGASEMYFCALSILLPLTHSLTHSLLSSTAPIHNLNRSLHELRLLAAPSSYPHVTQRLARPLFGDNVYLWLWRTNWYVSFLFTCTVNHTRLNDDTYFFDLIN